MRKTLLGLAAALLIGAVAGYLVGAFVPQFQQARAVLQVGSSPTRAGATQIVEPVAAVVERLRDPRRLRELEASFEQSGVRVPFSMLRRSTTVRSAPAGDLIEISAYATSRELLERWFAALVEPTLERHANFLAERVSKLRDDRELARRELERITRRIAALEATTPATGTTGTPFERVQLSEMLERQREFHAGRLAVAENALDPRRAFPTQYLQPVFVDPERTLPGRAAPAAVGALLLGSIWIALAAWRALRSPIGA